MALKVWLPLNGNLENKGISDITVTNNGATVDNNGKIGKCYSFDGTDDRIYSTAANLNNQEASYACWVKITSYKQYGFTFSLGDVKANTSQMSCYIHHTNHNVYICCNGSELNSGFLMPLNEWHHLCFTYKNTESKLYIDGTLRYTGTNAGNYKTSHNLTLGARSNSANGAGSSFSYPMEGYMNDFRIYDHCLSALEVKEISQGLILHYKLDGFNGGVGENLLSKYVSPGQQNPGVTTTAGRTNYYGDYGIIIPATENADTYFRLFLDKQLEQNVQYTISCEVSGLLSGSYYRFPLFAQNNTSMGILQLDHNGLCSLTFTMTYSTQSAVTINGRTVYICFMDDSARSIASGQGAITIKNFKLEKGSIATPWTPALSETGVDTTTIIDSSGYGNDGSVLSTLSAISDTERYEISTSFNGTDSGILIENLNISNIINNAITYSFWIKPNGENGARSIYFGSYNSTSWSVEKTAGNVLRLYWNGSPDETCTGATITDGIWQHVCITKNGSNDIKVYINGVQKWASTTTHNALTFPTTYRIGRDIRSGDGTPYKGLMSDFRIYATALSAGDILKLYHTPTEIDKNGSWHTHEFYENGENFITKNGLIKDSASSEYPFTQHLKYDPEIYFEPDGSAWVHIYHHNNPGAGSFASSNTFSNSCYIDVNRWFNATEICNQLNKWEFLVKYAFTSGGVEYKERWIQTKNPEDAVFADVDAADITRITGNGYKTGTWGGLYKKNNSAYWVMNNGNSGNWWGATGSFSVYQSGIPGYGGTVTTTGYNDLYIRIDNIDFDQVDKAWITKSNIYLGNILIEK